MTSVVYGGYDYDTDLHLTVQCKISQNRRSVSVSHVPLFHSRVERNTCYTRAL